MIPTIEDFKRFLTEENVSEYIPDCADLMELPKYKPEKWVEVACRMTGEAWNDVYKDVEFKWQRRCDAIHSLCECNGTVICATAEEPDQQEDKYGSLKSVLDAAFSQASSGKGKERHANDNKYEDQVICVVQRLLKDHPFGGHAFQIIKKTIEAGRLYKTKGKDAAMSEMLGAINYAGAMCILIEEGE